MIRFSAFEQSVAPRPSRLSPANSFLPPTLSTIKPRFPFPPQRSNPPRLLYKQDRLVVERLSRSWTPHKSLFTSRKLALWSIYSIAPTHWPVSLGRVNTTLFWPFKNIFRDRSRGRTHLGPTLLHLPADQLVPSNLTPTSTFDQ